MTEPDYFYWDSLEEWTLEQAAYLLYGLDPRHEERAFDVFGIKRAIESAAFSDGELPYKDDRKREMGVYESTGETFFKTKGDYLFKVIDLKEWATIKNIK